MTGDLFNRLKSAVENHEDIKDILKSSGIQDVLNTRVEVNYNDGTKIYYTPLTYAIHCGNIKAAKAILDTADQNTLKILLERESTIQYGGSTKKLHTALSFAKARKKHLENWHKQLTVDYQSLKDGRSMHQSLIEENGRLRQGYQSLIEEIKGKMQELGIPVLDEEEVVLEDNASSAGASTDSGSSYEDNIILEADESDEEEWKSVDSASTDSGSSYEDNIILEADQLDEEKLESAGSANNDLDSFDLGLQDRSPQNSDPNLSGGNEDPPVLVKSSSGDEEGDMNKDLCDELIYAIKNGQDTKNILKIDGIQKVLGTFINVSYNNKIRGTCTSLVYAINFDNIEVAENILDTADPSVLKTLLIEKSTIQYVNDTVFHTALSFAEERKKHFENQHEQLTQRYQSLIEKIKGKMQELTSRAANDLFWAVLKGDNKYADSLLTEDKKDIQAILRSSLMRILCIDNEQARELDEAGNNTTIIKEIQTRQAVGIGIVGGLLLAGAIVTFVFAPIIIGIIATVAGFAVVGFAAYHGLKAVPNTEMDEVDNAEHTGPEQTV